MRSVPSRLKSRPTLYLDLELATMPVRGQHGIGLGENSVGLCSSNMGIPRGWGLKLWEIRGFWTGAPRHVT